VIAVTAAPDSQRQGVRARNRGRLPVRVAEPGVDILVPRPRTLIQLITEPRSLRRVSGWWPCCSSEIPVLTRRTFAGFSISTVASDGKGREYDYGSGSLIVEGRFKPPAADLGRHRQRADAGEADPQRAD